MQIALNLGKPFAFSFDDLKGLARRMVGEPYVRPAALATDILDQLDYEEWGKIAFNTDYALFADGPFPVTFFHLGRFFQKPVEMYVVDGNEASKIIYAPNYFNIPVDSVARRLPPDIGFAGFRFQEALDGELDWRTNDWVAFLASSYFRAIGELYQYGLLARGVAVDTAVSGISEEFPDFTKFYIVKPSADDAVTVYALLEGPSAVGAYKFVMTRGKGVIMDIEQDLFLRRTVTRLGIASLTSMYWFSKTAKPTAIDWRPEVHDSDGLAVWTGRGEHLWRPLNNPPSVGISQYADENPKGFGLLQRDRLYDHYRDGVHYERRPSLWVEPKGSWGKGTVELIELPTNDEIYDNIVAMWVPAAPVAELDVAYRLHWLADEPYPTELARCVATRLGNGGQPGRPRPANVRKFLVEFLGGPLDNLPQGVKPTMTLFASRGVFTDYKLVEADPDNVPGHWRVQFDLADVNGPEPVEMRLHLSVGGKIVSETWVFQYHPF